MKKTKAEYEEFLSSAEWKNRKIKHYRSKQNKECYCCNRTSKLCVHHIRYRKPWGKERAKDLVTLCEFCHNEVHRLAKRRIKLENAHKILRKRIRKERGIEGSVKKKKNKKRWSEKDVGIAIAKEKRFSCIKKYNKKGY